MDIEQSYKHSTRWLLPLFVASLLLIFLWLLMRSERTAMPAETPGRGAHLAE